MICLIPPGKEMGDFTFRKDVGLDLETPQQLTLFSRGYTVKVAGVAAYVIKCASKNATRADCKKCPTEVPVSTDGTLTFSDPSHGLLAIF